ncbi:MAG: SCO family protein [Vicinamibacterales bacterium]
MTRFGVGLSRFVVSWLVLLLVLTAPACSRSPTREYVLTGQVLAVDEARQEITIKHGDIPGFMPGMTMAFGVRDGKLLAGRVPGDLVKATLVVEESDVHLRTLERIGHAPVPEDARLPAAMDLLAPGEPVTDAALVDETGAPRTLAGWRGKVLAVTFIYTRCPLPNFCPLMDRHFKAVQEQVGGDAGLKGRVQLLSVSFDPDHDTPAILAKHAAQLQADPAIWHFLTGTRGDVETFASQFGVSVIRDDPREIVHNLRTAVIDAQGRLTTVLNGGDWTPGDLMAELRKANDAGAAAGRPR